MHKKLSNPYKSFKNNLKNVYIIESIIRKTKKIHRIWWILNLSFVIILVL